MEPTCLAPGGMKGSRVLGDERARALLELKLGWRDAKTSEREHFAAKSGGG